MPSRLKQKSEAQRLQACWSMATTHSRVGTLQMTLLQLQPSRLVVVVVPLAAVVVVAAAVVAQGAGQGRRMLGH